MFVFYFAGTSSLWGLLCSYDEQGLLSSCSAWTFHCCGFFCWRPWTSGCAGFSSCSMWAQWLQLPDPGTGNRLNSCGTQVYLLHSMWYLPGPGLNLCPLHWQADSLPLSHQGSPSLSFMFICLVLAVACRILIAMLGLISSCDMWASLPCGMWDLSSLTRDQTHIPCTRWRILNHWTTREVPEAFFTFCAKELNKFSFVSSMVEKLAHLS